MITNTSELYYKTDLKNFEEEIVNSLDILKLVKIIIQVAPKEAGEVYANFLRKEIKELQMMQTEEILSRWDRIDFSHVSIDRKNVIQTLTKHCKTALAGSLIAERMDVTEIPKCYKKFGSSLF